MGNYRDKLQIVADILYIVNGRAKKTRIMYQANLSYRLLCRYLTEVTDAGLIRSENDDSYVLTAKGKEFLGRHGEYAKRRRSLEERLDSVNCEKNALVKMCSSSNKRQVGSRLLKKSKKRAE